METRRRYQKPGDLSEFTKTCDSVGAGARRARGERARCGRANPGARAAPGLAQGRKRTGHRRSSGGDGARRGNFSGDAFLAARLQQMETTLTGREWLTDTFTVADILMADVLRLVGRFDGLADHPACRAYITRTTGRPAFIKAHADQMAHFAAADKAGHQP